MYENGNKHRLRIDLPSINFPKFNKNNGNKRTIFSVISKFLVVCVFFFIFIFCISKYGTVVTKKEINENEFNSNLTYVKEQMIKYYDKNNIPQKKGDNSSLSFEELIGKKIIDKTKIEDVDNCDLKESYVTLTKKRDNMYNLKIHIICNGTIEEKEDTLTKI